MLALVACDQADPPAPAPRVDIAKSPPQKPDKTVEAFCDVYPAADQAPAFVWPKLTGAPPGPVKTWRWVNIWATWCKPCVEEIPRIGKWKPKLAAAGRQFDFVLVSADESDSDLADYQKDHADTQKTLRVADVATLETWAKQIGVGKPILPIHVFVDANDKVRCVRGGSVRDQDYPAIERLLMQ
jgi:thiol-disulfide isomerase/thioredoxin